MTRKTFVIERKKDVQRDQETCREDEDARYEKTRKHVNIQHEKRRVEYGLRKHVNDNEETWAGRGTWFLNAQGTLVLARCFGGEW